jgi:A/G-specific adenine glycosylase
MTQPLNFAPTLLAWYDTYQRVLPWRTTSPDPYEVWLSETMLQQTTVATVKGYFEKFTSRWRTVKDLANAPLDDVLHAWQGLGYYARARNLHKTAKIVTKQYGGVFPTTEQELRKLAGVGAYTAAAIGSIAFNQRGVVVDSNVERIIARVFAVEKPVSLAKKQIWALTDSITPQQRAGDFAQSMMDLGSLICTARAPKCLMCPVNSLCTAFEKQTVAQYPVKPVKQTRPTRYGVVLWVENVKQEVWIRKRPPSGLLGGLMEIPSTDWLATPVESKAGLVLLPSSMMTEILNKPVTHTFTHFHLVLTIVKATVAGVPALESGRWLAVEALPQKAWSTLMKKVLAACL